MAYVSDDEQLEFVEKEFSAREIDEMRAAINDPRLSLQDRKNLLYALSNAGRLSDEEIEYYAKEVGADAEDVEEGGTAVHLNMTNARKSLEKARELSPLNTSSVSEAYESLNFGGFSTSDEMIDQIESVMSMFETYYPMYEKACQYVPVPAVPPAIDGGTESTESIFGNREGGGQASYPHTGLDPDSIRDGLREFRGIVFSAFRADSQMLGDAHKAVSGHADSLESAWKDNTDDWTGEAKDAAEQLNQGLSQGAETLVEGLSKASEDLAAAADGLEGFVGDFCKKVIELYGNGQILMAPNEVDANLECAEKLPEAISWANNNFEWGDYEYMLPRQGRLIEHFWKSDFLEECETLLRDAEAKLTEFCNEYQTKASSFHRIASDYVRKIDGGYAEMIQVIGSHIEPNPFEAVDAGGGDSGSVQTPTNPSGVPGGPGGGGMGGMPGGGMGGGGGMPPGGGASMPSANVPDPEDLKPEESIGKNPVTNEELEIDPETGKPYPIDPVTGEPIKDAGDGGKLTVEQGDQKLTMTEPDEDGVMDISVEDGSGELSEYKLDFGETEGEGAEADGEGRARDDFGPQGSESAGDKVYRPGPDGKIHIEDGDLKITAEQPDGPDGPTVVTVENGDGESVTYTLGEGEAKGLGEEIETKPAEAESSYGTRGADTPRGEAPTGGSGGGAPTSGETPTTDAGRGTESVAAGGVAGGHAGGSAGDFAGDPGGGGTDGPSTAETGSDSSATHAAAVSGGGGSSFGGGGGGSDLFSDVGQEPQHQSNQSSPSGAGLASAPGGEAPTGVPQGNAASASSASGGGMGMMGGMGAMGGGAGGGQGDDQERTSRAYRIDGNIFELPFESSRISGSLEGAPDVPVRFSR
ncbi:hypothetical protein [Saccharomonospora glauca]|uniref:WXG repeat protein n=1 Tax=Saccharomonospora glauca K62 TaxID=928724 RepID=I1CXN5_9PSEU|nr:hypothetical protein [Saccharomonospora glauca]EIE97459.1 WXG repeat protein [Saccharomonospora glauca K62]